jgi:outer membrane protein TolC
MFPRLPAPVHLGLITFAALAALLSTLRAQAPLPPAAPAPELLAAVTRAPQLAAAAQRIAAARARTDSSGPLADPEVEAMGSRVNDAMGANRTMWELSVRQPLPKRGERAADRERALAVVTMAEADYAMLAGDVAADVAMALAEADGADARAELLAAQLTRLSSALAAVDARLASGLAPRLADRLTVQSRVAAFQLQLEQTRRTAADARASARGRLALAPDAPLPAYATPASTEINPADSATVAVATARIAEANAMGKMARASAAPMTSVGLRFERERSAMGNTDTVGLALSSELPWRNRRYARAEIRAAESDRAAATADATAARHRISSTLARVERAERLAATARRLSAETQTRLDAEHEALTRSLSVTGMGANESAVLHAIDILDRSTETQLQIIEAETSARATRAELWRYRPPSRLVLLP